MYVKYMKPWMNISTSSPQSGSILPSQMFFTTEAMPNFALKLQYHMAHAWTNFRLQEESFFLVHPCPEKWTIQNGQLTTKIKPSSERATTSCSAKVQRQTLRNQLPFVWDYPPYKALFEALICQSWSPWIWIAETIISNKSTIKVKVLSNLNLELMKK